MKKLLFLLLSIITVIVVSCTSQNKKDVAEKAAWKFYGDTITADNAVDVNQIPVLLAGKDSVVTKVTGTIESVCQKKGCWMKLKMADNKSIMVRFKDYGFFMPKDAAGKEVIINGYAFNDTTSVQMLQHYAEDAGKSKEEIAKITQPEVDLSFEANGVLIKND